MSLEIETYINALLLKQVSPVQTYDYYVIARDTGYSEEQIRAVCFCIDGGHNGFTIVRHDINSAVGAIEMSQAELKK